MLYVYTPSRKFDTIKISVIYDIIKIFKKIKYIKDIKNRFCIIIIVKSYQQII